MSGPPYPPPPPNFIGEFIIGESPIGTEPAFNLWTTVQSEYANTTALMGVITSFFAAEDATEFFDNFYDDIWNVATAQGYGLDVWGRIVGVGRVVQVASGSNLGFEEAGEPGISGFNQSPFYSGGTVTTNFALSDTAFRQLIYAKALANISSGSIPALNQILLTLFPGEQSYVTVSGSMAMTYTFNFTLSPVQQSIAEEFITFLTPAGVAATIVINP